MISREDFLQSLRQEADVCKHLFGKVTPDMLDYRPTSNQRSLQELLLAITRMPVVSTRCLLAEDFSQAREQIEKAYEKDVQQFPALMDAMYAEMEQVINEIPEEDFLSRDIVLPSGQRMKVGAALINFPLKFFTAYRMQVFLYCKAAGLTELDTYNCWFGMDNPRKS